MGVNIQALPNILRTCLRQCTHSFPDGITVKRRREPGRWWPLSPGRPVPRTTQKTPKKIHDMIIPHKAEHLPGTCPCPPPCGHQVGKWEAYESINHSTFNRLEHSLISALLVSSARGAWILLCRGLQVHTVHKTTRFIHSWLRHAWSVCNAELWSDTQQCETLVMRPLFVQLWLKENFPPACSTEGLSWVKLICPLQV